MTNKKTKTRLDKAEPSPRAAADEMPQTVRPLPLEVLDRDDAPPATDNALAFVGAEPIALRIVFGRARLASADANGLRSGAVISLDPCADEPVEVHAGAKLIARGDAVVVDGKLGVRITELTVRQTPPQTHKNKQPCGLATRNRGPSEGRCS